jgi:dihydroxyacetone kinase
MLPKKKRAALLDAKEISTGPIISNADGVKSQNRTYPDMLKKTRMMKSILRTS